MFFLSSVLKSSDRWRTPIVSSSQLLGHNHATNGHFVLQIVFRSRRMDECEFVSESVLCVSFTLPFILKVVSFPHV